MRQFITAPSVFFLLTPAIAQQNNKPAFPAKDLSVHWIAVQNDYQNKPRSLNAIIITNNGPIEFPAKGWKMYFNSARLIAPVTINSNARIDLMNGDLFSLTPTD